MAGAMLDDVILFTVFSRVVETRSFTAAAAALGVTKATVSQRVAALERRCAARLFQRTTRKLSVTREGQQLYEACLGMTVAADAAAPLIGRVGRVPHGQLRVTAPVGFGTADLIPTLPAFRERYPAITIDLVLTDRMVDLHDEQIDVAVRVASRLPSSAYGARRLRSDTLVVCGAPAYLARRGVPQTPDDLRKHDCLRLATSPREWAFRVDGESVIVPVSGPLRCDNVFALRDAAICGGGLAVLPRSILREQLRRGELEVVLADFVAGKHGVWIVLPDTHNIPEKVRVFVTHLTSALGQRTS
jgi:DNA-binding transcriptional LysR family regulator